ncbi:MAG: hypothetical protein KME52_01180 [Desmonostoc geniculatum HA4340-LM1]|nr:hypothetical protein [Desmonostoc geniculatum HA4340-LM1]
MPQHLNGSHQIAPEKNFIVDPRLAYMRGLSTYFYSNQLRFLNLGYVVRVGVGCASRREAQPKQGR